MTDLRYLLNNSRTHARTIGSLSESLKVSRREIEAAVQAARLNGVPIVSGSEGLWISDSPEEVARAAESLRKRLVTQYATVRALRATARRMAARKHYGEILQTELGWVA